jgi:3-hydroxybutyryl-CoA dehydratase
MSGSGSRGGADAASGLSKVLNQRTSFTKTVGESDVYLFAGITGDLHPNHVDEAYMSTTAYGHRIAHGALLIGFMSAASTLMTQRIAVAPPQALVSYGYDRIRFVKAAYIGDTLTVDYRVERVDEREGKTFASVSITNQHRDVVCVATHILKVVAGTAAPSR